MVWEFHTFHVAIASFRGAKGDTQIQEIKDRKVMVSLYREGREVSREVAPQLHAGQHLANTIRWSRLGTNLQPVYLDPGADLVQWHKTWTVLGTTPTVEANPAAAKSAPADQIAALKKQIAEIQKSLEALETSLKTPPQATEPTKSPTPQEQK